MLSVFQVNLGCSSSFILAVWTGPAVENMLALWFDPYVTQDMFWFCFSCLVFVYRDLFPESDECKSAGNPQSRNYIWSILVCCHLLPSSRCHLSNDDWLEDKKEDYQNCSVQCCIWQLYTMIHTPVSSYQSWLLVMTALCNRGAIIFLPCNFYLLLSSFFSSPNLNGRRLDVYHTLTHGVALVRI